MSLTPVTSSNIIRCVARLRFGNDSHDRREKLRRDLKRFRAHSGADISDTAIDNWFGRNAAGPRREQSISFLYDYFSQNVVLDSSASREQKNLHSLVEEYLRPPVHSPSAPVTRAPDSVDAAALKRGAVAQWTEDREALLQFRALEGAYQLIRPHASSRDRYILEPMAVHVDEQQGTATLRMYSHNHRVREYAYEGVLYASFRYGFSLIRRKHDENPARLAIRCINLHIGTHREAEGYVSHACLSGLMLRGVAANTGPIRTIAAPFIALKAPAVQHDFALAEFVSVDADVRRLHNGSSILTGDARGSTPLFQFCDRVFSGLSRDISSGLVLNTLRPEIIEQAVRSAVAGTHDTPFAIWSHVVEAHATAQKSKPTEQEQRDGQGQD
jgi:hypothetical protein